MGIAIYSIEQQFNVTFQSIAISVDNDNTLDMSIVYNSPIDVTDQHYDLLSTVRILRSKINSPLRYERVTGHLDKTTPYQSLTHLEQLNVECDLIAKFALKTFFCSTSTPPKLASPFRTMFYLAQLSQAI